MPKENVSIAFYNLENLFDTINDPHILDDGFTKNGELRWDEERYRKKLKQLSQAIVNIGKLDSGVLPSLVGVAEVENKKVLNDLIDQPALKAAGYDYVHFNSPDERGIDTALLYRKEDFNVFSAEAKTLHIESRPGVRDFTRDILYVHGKLLNIEIHLLVNHWPSRREGVEASQPKRIAAAEANREIIQQITSNDPDARIVVMGDFNDGPQDVAIREHLVGTDLYNPMVFLHTRYAGSSVHRGDWFLFDQIILSTNWMKAYDNPIKYVKSDIHDPEALQEQGGRFDGNPHRTYAGPRYLGGASDHFPVYVVFAIT
ncbi:MAG: endonuclease [Leeuwenhoekiella sp.]